MKNKTGILYTAVIGMILVVTACTENMNYYLGQVQDDAYKTVYMTRSVDNPYKESVYLTDELQQLVFGAAYGSVYDSPVDIKINFSVNPGLVTAYNEEYGTHYEILPDDCYELETTTAVIRAGTSSTGAIHVNLSIGNKIDVGEPYLLPISIESTEPVMEIPEGFEHTFFLIAGSFKPGEVPREKVGSFDTSDPGLLFTKGEDLIRLDTGGNLLLYRPDPEGIYEFSRQIGWGWDGVDIMFYMPENRFLARKPDSNIEQYNINDQYEFLYQRTIGWGWGGMSKMFPLKDIMVLGVENGVMTKYPLSQSGDWDYGLISAIATGWDIYTILLCWEESIIAVDGDGYMWEIPISDDGVLGSFRRMGTGWNEYTHLMKAGNNLLAIDANGDVWKYKFNINSYWPLIAENE